MDKQSLKRYIINKRKAMSDNEVMEKSMIISKKLLCIKEYQLSDIILCYASCRNEVMTDFVIEYSLNKGKRVALPKVTGKKMDFYFINSLDDLKPGYMQIPEPPTTKIVKRDDASKAFMVIPGTSFDKKFNRNGYGGGYYDRYIESYPPKCIAGIAFEFQIFDEIPNEVHDKKVDYIISEVNVYGK